MTLASLAGAASGATRAGAGSGIRPHRPAEIVPAIAVEPLRKFLRLADRREVSMDLLCFRGNSCTGMGFKTIARKYTGWIDGQTWQSQIFGEQNRSITSQIPMLNLPRFSTLRPFNLSQYHVFREGVREMKQFV